MDTIIAIYEDGVLRPLTDVGLPDKTKVRLQIIEEMPFDEIQYPLLAFANLGRSKEKNVSERAEDILLNEVEPKLGWGKSDADSG